MSRWAAFLEAADAPSEALRAAMRDPRPAQERLLRDILAAGAASEFGRQHGFSTIRDVDAYRSRVPIRPYEELRPFIERIALGEPGVLTGDEVVAFEETGGSSGGAKLIPYTRRSLDAFGAAILPWIADLLRFRPRIAQGRAYFAISPATRRIRRTPSGMAIGLESDAAYLGPGLGAATASLSVVPASIARIADVEEWSLVTAAHLVAAEDLSFVSVWSPTFLSGLLGTIRSRATDIAALLRRGAGALTPRPERADHLDASLGERALDIERLWPGLDTVSAWMDGSSTPYARLLQAEMPDVHLQGKGLLATEGVMTLPLSRAAAPVPALTSSFLEFIDSGGRSRLADELDTGETYAVVMTTWGGLYRYAIGDSVVCCGQADDRARLPMLRFLGRGTTTSDLVGEKLTEGFVSACLSEAGRFCALFPIPDPPAGYGLVIEADAFLDPGEIVARIERALRGNPQYEHARRHGQLAPLRAFPVARAGERHLGWALRQGRRLADIKPLTLISDASLPRHIWPAEFRDAD